ncbi:MAG: class I SAM-dependent methyltransferase [Bacteroidota bacterium]
MYTSPRPTIDTISRYYHSDQYISHTNRSTTVFDIVYKIARFFTNSQKVRLLKSLKSEGTILDYGCGTGYFATRAASSGYNVVAYEPDSQAASQIQSRESLKVIESLTSISAKSLDLITAWHVIEHVHNPMETLSDLRKKLKKGGHLIVAVPNYKSYDSNYYKENWAALDVPRHLTHFSKRSFEKFAAVKKMKLVGIQPMKLDSYYVALLTEMKVLKKKSFIKAFQIGRKSNRKARISGDYSSLIYVLKK